MAANKRKQDEKHLKILRDIASLTHNRQCFDCGQRGPTYVNMTIGSFVCTSCSGILRGINPPQRIKSISMTSFSTDDIEFLKCHGNDFCRKVWLGLYDSRTSPEFTSKDEQKIKDFMAQKYEKKRWYVAPTDAMKEEARKMNEPIKQPTTKPLRQLLGANVPKLIVPPAQVGQSTASPVAQHSQSTQQPAPQLVTSQPTTVSSANATADLLGALGTDPFASSTQGPPAGGGGGGFANFDSFNTQGSSFPVASNPTNFLQPLGSQNTSAATNSLLSTSPQQAATTGEKYAGLGDLFSVEVEPAAPAATQKINWDGSGGSASVNWNSSSSGGGVDWNSSGWSSSSGVSTFGSTGMTAVGASDSSSFGHTQGGNPFGASVSSTQAAAGNPFAAAPGQPSSNQNMFGGQQQAQPAQQQMAGFGQISGASNLGTFGATSNMPGLAQQANMAGFGSQPAATGFGTQPAATGYGVQPSAAGFGTQPSAAGYGAQPSTAGFGTQPSAAGYGAQPGAVGYGAQPGAAGYGAQPTSAAGFGAQANATGYGGMFGTVPQSQTGQFGMQNGGGTYPQQQGGWNQPVSQMPGFGQQQQSQQGLWQSQANTVSMGGAAMAGLATAQFKQQQPQAMQWGQQQPATMGGNPFMNIGAQQQVIPPKSNSTNPFL